MGAKAGDGASGSGIKGTGFTAYTGAAPAPSRSISLADSGGAAEPMTITDTAGLTNVGPPDLTMPPPLPRGMRTSAPPENPEATAILQEMRAQIGELQRSIGTIKSDYESRLEEQQLNHQLELLAMRGVPQPPALPKDVNAEQPVTIGDLNAVLSRFNDGMQVDMTRRFWDVTPEEEAAVAQANPVLAQIPEPARTIFVQKAVALRRKQQGTNGRSPAPTTTSPTTARGTTAAPVPGTPIQQHMVPMTEVGGPGDVGELTPTNALEQAQMEYRAADKIQNRTERLRAKKAASKKVQYALGITDEQMAKMAFSQTA